MTAGSLMTAGETLRGLRKARGWSQTELAAHAGRGASRRTIIEVEGGARATVAFIDAVCAALEVDPILLLAPGRIRSTPTLRKVEDAMPAIRRVLATFDSPRDLQSPPRGLPELAAAVDAACLLRLAARYGELAEVIVPLVEELSVVAHSATGRARERGFWLLACAYRCVDALVYKAGHPDVSAVSVERIGWAAERSGDPLMIATGAYVRAQGYFDLGPDATDQGLRQINRAAEAIAAPAASDVNAASIYGALHARAAVLAAKGGQVRTAATHLEAARTAAALTGRDATTYGTFFGPGQLQIIEIATHVEMGDGDGAVEAARGWRPGPDMPSERGSHALIDLSRALTWQGRLTEAVECLVEARRIAPQHTRMHPLVAPTLETVRTLMPRPSTAVTTLAAWLGLPKR